MILTPVWGSTNEKFCVSTDFLSPLHLKYSSRAWAAVHRSVAGLFLTTYASFGSCRKNGMESLIVRSESSGSADGFVTAGSSIGSSRIPSGSKSHCVNYVQLGTVSLYGLQGVSFLEDSGLRFTRKKRQKCCKNGFLTTNSL